MILSLLLWIGITTHFETFDKILLSKILCFSGLILSISIFVFITACASKINTTQGSKCEPKWYKNQEQSNEKFVYGYSFV